jgi:hypothetical protein
MTIGRSSGCPTGASLQFQVVAGQAGGNTVDLMVIGSDGSSQRIQNAAALASTTQTVTFRGASVAVAFGSTPVTGLNIGSVGYFALESDNGKRCPGLYPFSWLGFALRPRFTA